VFRRGRATVTIIAVTAALVVAAGVTIILLPPGHGRTVGQASPASLDVPPVLRVASVTPAPGTREVNGTAPIRLTLADGLAAGAPLPRISPQIPGSWQRAGSSLVFTPATGFGPGTRVTITAPHSAWTASYTTGSYSLLRLQQLLAQLGYLPLSWSADLGGTVPPADASAQLAAAYQPPAGVFSWDGGYPAMLTGFWQPGQQNLITTGAIMAFESGHGLSMDGAVSPRLWAAVLHAAATQQQNPDGYTYAIASKVLPETLTIWHDGREVMRSEANTGIPVSPTANGTFPVYLRYRFQIMQGTNPDGSHYADPVQFVSYFHGGEAVHYFPRYTYGWPQSLGCVELPLDAAAQAWPYLTYGSLVTVYP
jgi:peptidoglycan hydrolase-like protein with peptidoglycan-binding domain